jgi:hypothetical protein
MEEGPQAGNVRPFLGLIRTLRTGTTHARPQAGLRGRGRPPNSRCLAPEDPAKAPHPTPSANPKKRFRGGGRSHVRLPRSLANNRTATSTRSAVHGPNPLADGPSAAVGENSYAGGAGPIQVLLRLCPVLLLSGHERSPPPAAGGGVGDGSAGHEKPPDLLPEPPLLFSWLFALLCATPVDRKSPVHSRLGACPDPASTHEPDEPRMGEGPCKSGDAPALSRPCAQGESPPGAMWKSACKRDPRRRRIGTHLRHTIHP